MFAPKDWNIMPMTSIIAPATRVSIPRLYGANLSFSAGSSSLMVIEV